MSNAIYVDQTLHGYADGHQLLATSTDLTPEQQSVLLIMSDLSGPAFRSGYESYLTGYPLSGGTIYGLARTWFAPELPRPGCVWTQTLLIKAEDLAQIINFECVNQLFQRPAGATEIGGYCRRLLLHQMPLSSKPSINARAVLRALYDSEKKIVISSESSQLYEPLLLALFEQQWPRLRRGFRFCSGALSLRDTEFELSVSPPEATHSLSEAGLLISNRSASPSPDEEWLQVASRDLGEAETRSEYREFLWRYGPDFSDGRAAYRPLTEIYCLLQSTDHQAGMERLLSAIGHFYPEPWTAARLKGAIFGVEGALVKRSDGEAQILRLLVSHPLASAIPPSAADVKARATLLAGNATDVATEIALLANELGGEYATQFLEGFLENTEWSPEFLVSVPPELLLIVVQRNPEILGHSALWERSDRMDWLGELVSRLLADQLLLKETLTSMMRAGAWDVISRLIGFVGTPAIAAILKHVDDDPSTIVDYPDAIYAEISRRNEAWVGLATQGSLGPRALKFLTAELDPRSWYVRRVELKCWAGIARAGFQFDSTLRELRSAIFSLSIGLSSWDREAATLVANGFSYVYAAAARDRIDESLWQQLEPSLTWYSPSWDKCARLIRSAARAFKDRSWPIQEFFLTFETGHELARALGEVDDTYGGYRFIREAKEQVLAGTASISDDQRIVLLSGAYKV